MANPAFCAGMAMGNTPATGRSFPSKISSPGNAHFCLG
jgi:hypothetical protein